MDKAIIKGREVILGNSHYGVDEIVCISLTTAGMALLFRNGCCLSADNTPADFYSLVDLCPWATRSVA